MVETKCLPVKTLRLKIALLNSNKRQMLPIVFNRQIEVLRSELYTAVTRRMRERRCG